MSIIEDGLGVVNWILKRMDQVSIWVKRMVRRGKVKRISDAINNTEDSTQAPAFIKSELNRYLAIKEGVIGNIPIFTTLSKVKRCEYVNGIKIVSIMERAIESLVPIPIKRKIFPR